jgi:hypothetical protein
LAKRYLLDLYRRGLLDISRFADAAPCLRGNPDDGRIGDLGKLGSVLDGQRQVLAPPRLQGRMRGRRPKYRDLLRQLPACGEISGRFFS